MSTDVLLVKSVTAGSEVFFSSNKITKYDMSIDVPLPSIPVLASWIKSKGYTLDVFDLDRNGCDQLLETVRDFCVIGFYLNYSGHFKVLNAIEQIKKKHPEKLVVIGGPSTTSLNENFFELEESKFFGQIKKNVSNYVDAIVYGEGEIAFETILQHKDSPDELGKLIDDDHQSSRGIIYRDTKRKLHISRKPGMVPDLGILPIPSFELNKNLVPVAFVETSRGCAFKCPFCEVPGLYNTRRVKGKKQVEAEINYIQQLGIKHVIITDPAIYPSKRMDMLSEIFAGRDMIWSGYAKPGTRKSKNPFYSKETLQKANKSGCISLFFGGESACETTQQMYNKPRPEVLLETERLCKDAGLLSCWSFMVLNPGEKSQDVDKLIELLIEMAPEMAVFTPFTLMPDSEMDKHPEAYDLRIKDPNYKLKVAELYAKLSKSAGIDKKKKIRRLVQTHPKVMRVLLKWLLRKADYFRCLKTGLGLADGAFETMRLEAALRRKTSIKVGKTNYHLVFEMAATGKKKKGGYSKSLQN